MSDLTMTIADTLSQHDLVFGNIDGWRCRCGHEVKFDEDQPSKARHRTIVTHKAEQIATAIEATR